MSNSAVPIIASLTGNEPIPVVLPTGNQAFTTGNQIAALINGEMGQPGGPAGPLDGTGKIPAGQLPPLDHDVGEAANQAAMLALAVTAPAVCIRTDFTPPHVFYLTADPATTLANWVDTGEFGAGAADPTAQVGLTAVNGVSNAYMRADAAPPINPAVLTQTGEANKIAQFDSGQVLNINSATFSAQYGADSIFVAGTGQWVNMDFSSQEIDFIKTGEDSVTIGLAGITTGSKPITCGSIAVAGVGTFVGSGVLFDGATAPWTMGGTTGNDGDVWTSHGNALSPGWTTHLPKVVGSASQSAQSADVNAPNIYAVAVGGIYRVSTFIVITQAATTSATMPSVNVAYTDAATGTPVQDIVSLSSVANTVGSHSGGTAVIQCQQNSNISYSTSNYASAGATTMQYRVDVVIERLS